MILIFDLDDTLYDEINYVKSGFKEVSIHIFKKHSINKIDSFEFMMNELNEKGRGKVFNALLEEYGIYNKKNLMKCIKVYREHRPKIDLEQDIFNALAKLNKKYSTYLVTDGNKIVQKNKVEALGIENLFKKIFITHRFGLKNAKPSLYCFEIIKKIERCNWSDLIYIGDNPQKDFVNLNKVGAKTARILNGSYRYYKPKKGYEAQVSYKNIRALLKDYE